ncbi:MAG: hypothetical protein AAFY59_06950 [Pseudomonadota bacterium]
MIAPPLQPRDGLAPNFWVDTLWEWRFRRARRRVLAWCAPTEDDRAFWAGRADLAPYGDWLDCVTDVDGRRWFAVSRDWHGWPDPPEFAVFALEPSGTVWMARDFANWPRVWIREGDGV